MRPDIDRTDEYVRNTTARAFSVVALRSSPSLRPSAAEKKSCRRVTPVFGLFNTLPLWWLCRASSFMKLRACIAHGLTDEERKVRTMAALGLAALAEVSAPYSIEPFSEVLKSLWLSFRLHHGKGLAAFLKAVGFIPLMDPEYASYYTWEVTVILVHEFQTSDEEMKKIVLKVVKQCAATEGVTTQYIKQDILPDFLKTYGSVVWH
ncbi:hypothetical protein HD554DRAFT_25735 [Boletus coccyginus]|nr:hypothetical protein HD554DRAFT_25735 [Boletus coccyginus]